MKSMLPARALRRALLPSAIVAMFGLALAEPAQAGTAFRDGSVLHYSGDADADDAGITVFTDRIDVYDTGGIVAGAGCSGAGGSGATCDLAGVTALIMDAGDGADHLKCGNWSMATAIIPCTVNGEGGNDRFTSEPRADQTLNGGPGDDELIGSVDDDTLNGGAGDDRLYPSLGADALDGGPGDDVMAPGAQSFGDLQDDGDVVAGGDGIDTIVYENLSDDLVTTFDGVADDGRTGENDNILTDIENYLGGQGSDTVVGSDGPNELYGGGSPAADVLDGGGGPDVLRSSRGDTLRGVPGDDVFDQAFVQAPLVALRMLRAFATSG